MLHRNTREVESTLLTEKICVDRRAHHIRHVQELLGHRSIESTVRYTHVMTDGLAKVYRRHHPREHELFEAVDDEYERRLSSLVARRPKEG
jgi:integrase